MSKHKQLVIVKYEEHGYEYQIISQASMLNTIGMLANEASKRYESEGYQGLASEAEEISDAIHQALDDIGYYDDAKEKIREESDNWFPDV